MQYIIHGMFGVEEVKLYAVCRELFTFVEFQNELIPKSNNFAILE